MSNLDPKAFVEMINSMDDYRALSYSGRAMYGKECVGVSVPRTTNEYKFIADILDAIAQDSMDEDELQDNLGWFSQQLKSASSDSFGLDTVFYFKRMEWVKEEELDGEEDECGACDGRMITLVSGKTHHLNDDGEIDKKLDRDHEAYPKEDI